MTSGRGDEESTQFDPEDLLSDSLQTLYDYAPITHSSAGSLFRYALPRPSTFALTTANHETQPIGTTEEAPDASVIALVTPNTQAGNWALHASSIWTSALFVADHIEDFCLRAHVQAARARRELPLRILELGAGAGLPSVVIAKTYEDVAVVASDYPDEELIAALEANVQRNRVAGCCWVVPYAWGNDPSVLFSSSNLQPSYPAGPEGFDVVLAADTLWNPDLHELFIKTLCLTLRRTPDARIYLVAGLHTGRYTLQTFMSLVEQFGLIIEHRIEREVSGDGRREWDVSRAEGEEEKERRRWVVNMTIRWNDLFPYE
jgi:EEF1A N-terminal glycine/lysine methyltransferase